MGVMEYFLLLVPGPLPGCIFMRHIILALNTVHALKICYFMLNIARNAAFFRKPPCEYHIAGAAPLFVSKHRQDASFHREKKIYLETGMAEWNRAVWAKVTSKRRPLFFKVQSLYDCTV
jgi:hypothetical protein